MQKKIFIDNKDYLNLEIGAGCGDFGKKFHSLCYLTDSNEELRNLCSSCHIDWFCDAHSLIWNNDRFENIFMCNPYNYGFNDEENAEMLLNELLRVSKKKNSKIVVIGSKSNKFCAPSRVEKYVKSFSTKNNIANLSVEHEDINCNLEYPEHVFKDMLGTAINPPTCRITIYVK